MRELMDYLKNEAGQDGCMHTDSQIGSSNVMEGDVQESSDTVLSSAETGTERPGDDSETGTARMLVTAGGGLVLSNSTREQEAELHGDCSPATAGMEQGECSPCVGFAGADIHLTGTDPGHEGSLQGTQRTLSLLAFLEPEMLDLGTLQDTPVAGLPTDRYCVLNCCMTRLSGPWGSVGTDVRGGLALSRWAWHSLRSEIPTGSLYMWAQRKKPVVMHRVWVWWVSHSLRRALPVVPLLLHFPAVPVPRGVAPPREQVAGECPAAPRRPVAHRSRHCPATVFTLAVVTLPPDTSHPGRVSVPAFPLLLTSCPVAVGEELPGLPVPSPLRYTEPRSHRRVRDGV